MYLPDINVWLALTFPSHQKHTAARRAFKAAPVDRLWHFCRYTQMAFLRLANNPAVFANWALTQKLAWTLYDQTLTHPQVAFADEPSGIEAVWRQWTQGAQFSTNVWNDAYLAAFAQACGYEIVSFDGGFSRYSGVALLLLK